MSASVLYSVAIPLNAGGLGTIAWHACRGLQKAGFLREILTPDGRKANELSAKTRDLPWAFRQSAAALNRCGWHYWKDSFFDRWASAWLEPHDIFYGWLHQSLASIRRCHQLDGIAYVDRGSVEPRLQDRWLKDAYRRHGLTVPPIPFYTVDRMVQEAEETDVIVAASTLVADSYVAAGYEPCKLRLNSLGVDCSMFLPISENQCRDHVRFLFVGQLSIQKGIPDLLEAWDKLKHPKAELVLAGTIPPLEYSVIHPLLTAARRLSWNGHCSDVPSLMRECDVLILPSLQDGFGLVVLEAFATGLPVIISDRVGARDCVQEEKNGLTFRYGDVAALTEKLSWFAEDPARASGMRAVALHTASRYSWEAYGERLAAIMRQSAHRH